MTTVNGTPQGWDEYTLGALLKFSNGINADKSAYGHGVPFANVLEVIVKESLDVGDIPGRVALPAQVLSRYHLQPGDVLFNRTSETPEEVGLASVYLDDAPAVFGGFVLRGRPIIGALVSEFAGYGLRANDVRRQIIARGQGGIRSNVGQRDLRTVRVVLPPPEEQHAIADVLSGTDELIVTLERLVSKKEAIKQGLMRELLTGRTQLPGFTDPWTPLTLDEITTSIKGGGTPSRSVPEFWGGDLPWVTAKDFATFDPLRTMESITSLGLANSASRRIPRETVLICVRMAVGKIAIYDIDVCINQDVKALFTGTDVDPLFLTYSLRLAESALARGVGGSTVAGISTRDLRAIQILLPSTRDEQRVVARFLGDADDEIAALRIRLMKAKAVKQGIMQELLTGRTRLSIVSRDEAAPTGTSVTATEGAVL